MGKEEGITCLLCLVNVHVFMGGIEGNGVANSVIWLREESVGCLSLELQQIECPLMHDVNDLYVTANCGHILIVHGLILSNCILLWYRSTLLAFVNGYFSGGCFPLQNSTNDSTASV